MGTGNGEDTSDHGAVSTATGTWVQLTAPNGRSPANEFIVYAVLAGGAWYYVDNASVSEYERPVSGQLPVSIRKDLCHAHTP
jgi:hypothetical protein